MKSLLLATALMCAATVPALADTWTGVYGNTITSTYSDGRVVKVYVNADHSYTVALQGGKTLNGSWADANGQSCFTLSSGGTPSCFPIKEYQVGDSLSGTDSTGSFTGVISAGR
jgi:hypothetical protein